MRRRIATASLVVVALVGAGMLAVAMRGDGRQRSAPLPADSPAWVAGAGGSARDRLPAPVLPERVAHVTDRPAARQADLGRTSLRIPALGVTATIGTATVDRGVLVPPRRPDVVGMWPGSAALDASSGEVTIAGHVNWAGMPPYAFGRLAYLRPGDLVYTTGVGGDQTAWRITAVTARPKSEPIDTGAFRGSRGPRTLALITCGGAFDASAHSYVQNIYVYANQAKVFHAA